MTLPPSAVTIALLVPTWLLMLAITLVTLRRNDRQRLQIDALNETVEEYEADLAEGQHDYLSTLAVLNQQHVRPSLEREAAAEKELLQVIKQRDVYHEWADKLAAAISDLTGEEIGEHSSANNPWANALDAAGYRADQEAGVSLAEAAEGYREFARASVKPGSLVQAVVFNADGTVDYRLVTLLGAQPPAPSVTLSGPPAAKP